MTPLTEGPLTDPVANAVLAQTGSLPGAAYRVGGFVYGQAPFFAILQQRRAGTTVWGQILPVTTAFVSFALPLPLHLTPGDSVRLVVRDAVVGEVQGSLFVYP